MAETIRHRQSSKEGSYCFRHRPGPVQAIMPTNRERKGEVELSSYKPQLSLLRDRDKLLLPRHPDVPALDPYVRRPMVALPPKSRKDFFLRPNSNNPSCCSISSLNASREQEKTNGCSNSANNCPMALLKYFSPSALFFFCRFFSWTSCPCSFYNHNMLSSSRLRYFWKCANKNEFYDKYKPLCMKRAKNCGTSNSSKTSDCKKMPSISVFFIVQFLFFAKLIQVVNGTPVHNIIPTPTQATILNSMAHSEDTNNEELRYIERLGKEILLESQVEQGDEYRHHHQLHTINNTTFDGGGTGVDELKEMKNEKNGIDVNTGKVHLWGRNLYSDSIKYESRNTSGNQLLEFTSPSANNATQKSPNNSNNKTKLEFGGRKEKESLTMVPLAVKMKTGAMILSSSSSPLVSHLTTTSKQQQKDALIQMTNDPPPEMKENSNKNDYDSESSFFLINNNNNNDDKNRYMRVPTATTITTVTCRPVLLGAVHTEGNETESLPSIASSSVSDSMLISTPTSASEDPMGLACSGINNLANTLGQISEHFVHQVISIVVKDSLISTLNLSLFHRFSSLENLSVTHSNITQIIGTCPPGLKALNISFNNIKKLNGSIFLAGAQEGEYDYDEGGTDDDATVESDSDNESMTSNFSTEIISSYFTSSAEQQLPQRRSKSEKELELLSLSSPSFSSSPEPSSEKMPITSRFSADYFYPEKLIGTPFVRTRTKKVSTIPNKELKQNELGEIDPSVFGISIDHQQHQQNTLIKTSKSNQQVSVNPETAFPETAETNESNAADEDEHDDDGDDSTLRKTYSDAETNRRADKIIRILTPTSSEVDFSVHDKEANKGCGINDSSCGTQRFLRRRRQVTREVDKHTEDGNHHHEHQQKRDDENINASVLQRLRNTNEEAQEETGTSGGEKYYHYLQTSSSTNNGAASSRSSIGNKWEDEIRTLSKPQTTMFSVDKRSSISHMSRRRKARVTTTTSSSSTTTLSLEDIDLSHNKIFELPRALLQLKSLKSLRLSGNRLKRDFVWEKLADWYMNSQDLNILKDGDDTFCGVVDDVRVFQFTVLGVLKAKKDLVETCRMVDKNICHECGLYSLNKQPGHGYNLSHQSPHGNVAIALKLDCSFRNLTELPAIPPQTWQLNVSGNSIKDFISLKDPMYENLLILDADANEISNLDGLIGTSFLDRYNYLSVQNNRFSVIPSIVLSSLKNMRGQGVTLLGANFIDCDCDTVKDTKPLLLENSKKIKDLKEVFCKDMKTRSGDSFMAVKDLQFTDLCYLDNEVSNEMYLYLIIFIELLLIFVIVGKVWHDQRTFRRTGILPWCSAKMPRLPCDAMLESVKEPPHFNRSSSTNVRSYACEPPATQSISSCVQLREVRSNSGQSEKSSQISQLSSFPGSSRTSSV